MNLPPVPQRNLLSETALQRSCPPMCNVDFAAMELLHARLVRTTTCVDGCRCDYTICGDQDPYAKEHPDIGMKRIQEE